MVNGGEPRNVRNHFIICGYGQVAETVVDHSIA